MGRSSGLGAGSSSSEVLVAGVPFQIIDNPTHPSFLDFLLPAWDETDRVMLYSLCGVTYVAAGLCFSMYLWGYGDPTVPDEVLTPILWLSCLFFGIAIGFTGFTLTRKFYNSKDVLHALKVAHKSLEGKTKHRSKLIKTARNVAQSVTKRTATKKL